MKKLFITVGLVAAGTASLQADYAPGLTSMQTTKIWSVSSTLRGFYDDNYTTSPNGQKQGSAGFELSPSVQLSVPLQQTEIAVKYTYGLYYYQERQNQGNDPYDQTHQVDLWVDHAFTERWQGTVKDTFVIGQEPSLFTNPGQPAGLANPYRVNGNNIANFGTTTLTTDWTRLFSTVLTYNNGYYQYQQSGGNNAPPYSNPSQNGVLTRLDQSIALDLQWNVSPETVLLTGFMFEFLNYWGNEPIGENNTGQVYYSDSRNYYSYVPYIGFQHQFLPNLNASAKVGVQISDYYNDPSTPTYVTPYLSSSASYTYSPGSYLQLGVSHSQNSTYVSAVGSNGQITQGQQSTVIDASVNQQITDKLTGSVIGSVQLSRYYQGAYNNNEDEDYGLGLNLSYAFNQHFSTEVGYNLDLYQSNVPGNGYSRNRVYLGVTAAY